MTQLPLDLGDSVSTEEPSAVISDDGRYRYELRRRWAPGPLLEWVMLNPSTADAAEDDPTIRRCIKFARDWGFNGIRVTNLFAYRATNPDELGKTNDPFGPENSEYLRSAFGPITVCAWGSHKYVGRVNQNTDVFERENTAFLCLGYNQDGSPKHPLYVPANRGLSPWPKLDPKERNY